MRGVKSEDLTAIVDFLYSGEANVLQENLDTFLALAGELRLKGLMGGADETNEIQQENSLKSKPNHGQSTFPLVMKEDNKKCQILENKDDLRTVALIGNNFSEYMEELDLRVKSMMEKGSNTISYGKGRLCKANVCKICGKEGQVVAIRDHIEANHLEGISLPCNLCGKTFRSRNSLKVHKFRDHKQ